MWRGRWRGTVERPWVSCETNGRAPGGRTTGAKALRPMHLCSWRSPCPTRSGGWSPGWGGGGVVEQVR